MVVRKRTDESGKCYESRQSGVGTVIAVLNIINALDNNRSFIRIMDTWLYASSGGRVNPLITRCRGNFNNRAAD
jgi:hypothetical protein